MTSTGSSRHEPGHARPSAARRRPLWRLMLAAALAAAVVVAAIVLILRRPAGQPSHAVSPAPASSSPIALPAGPLVPAHGALFGAYAQPTGGYNYPQFENAILQLEHRIGRKLAIDNLYSPWDHSLPINIAQWDLKQGIVPMISWAGAGTVRITSGAYDKIFRAIALQLKALHGPVMLRWFYEMDGSGCTSSTEWHRRTIRVAVMSTGSAQTDTTGRQESLGRHGRASLTSFLPSTGGESRRTSR